MCIVGCHRRPLLVFKICCRKPSLGLKQPCRLLTTWQFPCHCPEMLSLQDSDAPTCLPRAHSVPQQTSLHGPQVLLWKCRPPGLPRHSSRPVPLLLPGGTSSAHQHLPTVLIAFLLLRASAFQCQGPKRTRPRLQPPALLWSPVSH